MEDLGTTIDVSFQETVTQNLQASKFRILAYKVLPLSHGIDVEVSFFDADEQVLGGAVWVKVNPLPPAEPEGEEQDNWAVLVNKTLIELNALVKARLLEVYGGA